MSTPAPSEVTRLLLDWKQGDRVALDKLAALVYAELRQMADRYLRLERRDHTLQPTALVNEAYLKLIDQSHLNWQNRAHFFGVAAQVMRHILVDYARRHRSAKRGSGDRPLPLEAAEAVAIDRPDELIALDEAITALTKIDPRKARAIELRYFAGLGVEETAEATGVSIATVRRDLRMAEAWLHRELDGTA